MDIKLLVVAHKKYRMPEDDIYLPIQVGKGESIPGFQRDNQGDNISEKNYCYCELTALFWAWKNLKCDYLGLVHYRRHFKNKKVFGNKFNKILDRNTLEHYLTNNDILLPKKRHYFIESNRNQYLHSHHKEGLENCENVIKTYYPDYLESWNYVMKISYGHRFNMIIAKKAIMDDYCLWLFDILEKVENMTDISDWSDSEQRIFGYLSERLLDVWLIKNNYKYKDLPYMFMEKMNWFKKIFNFLKRKFSKKEQ